MKKLVPIAFATLLVAAGTAAALPGSAPVDAGAENSTDERTDAPDERTDRGPDASENAGDEGATTGDGAADRRGPPSDLPGPVPDHVERIHDLPRSFLDGGLDGSPGGAVSDATPDDGDARNVEGNATDAPGPEGGPAA